MIRRVNLLRICVVLSTWLLCAGAAAAQWSTIPGSGCPNASSLVTQGNPVRGGTISVGCLNNGRSAGEWMLIGAQAQSPFTLPRPLGCVDGCVIAVDLAVAVAVPTGFNPVMLTIPNDPNLAFVNVAFQCIELVPGAVCLSASEGALATIQ
jgi:hypothetical protein